MRREALQQQPGTATHAGGPPARGIQRNGAGASSSAEIPAVAELTLAANGDGLLAASPGLLDVLGSNALEQRAQESFYELLCCDGSRGALRQASRASRDWVDGNATQLDFWLHGDAHRQQEHERNGQPAAARSLLERSVHCTRVTVSVEPGWPALVGVGGGGGGSNGGGDGSGGSGDDGDQVDVAAALAAALGLCSPSSVAIQRVTLFTLRFPGEAQQGQQQPQQGQGQQGRDDEGAWSPPPVLSPQHPHALAVDFPRLTRLALEGSWRLPPDAHPQREFFVGLARLPHLTTVQLDTYGCLRHVRLLAEGCPCLRVLRLVGRRLDVWPGVVVPDEDPVTSDVAAALASMNQLRMLQLWLDLLKPCLGILLSQGLAPNLERLECCNDDSSEPEYALTSACGIDSLDGGNISSDQGSPLAAETAEGRGGAGGCSGGGHDSCGASGCRRSRQWDVQLETVDLSLSELLAAHTVQSGICVRSFRISLLSLGPMSSRRVVWGGIEQGTWREDSPIRRLLRECPNKSLSCAATTLSTAAGCTALNLVVPLLGPPEMLLFKGEDSSQQLLGGLRSLLPAVAAGITVLGVNNAPAVTPESVVAALGLLPALFCVRVVGCTNLCTETHARGLAGCLVAASGALLSRTVVIMLVAAAPVAAGGADACVLADLEKELNQQLRNGGCLGITLMYKSP